MQEKTSVTICRSTPIAPDPRVERAAATLAASGISVIVVGWDRGWNLPPNEGREGYVVVRIPLTAPFGGGLRNLLGVLRWQVSLFVWLLKHCNLYAIIHACDLDTAIPAFFIAKICRKSFVLDIFDSYADAFRVGPFYRIIRWLEALVAAQADAVIIADEVRRNQLRNVRPKRLVVTYNSPPDLYSELDRREEKEGFRIVYVGLLDVTRGLLTLLDVMVLHPDWTLDLAGFGVDERRIAERARNLQNVRFHGRVDYKQALQLMAAADVMIATYDPSVPNHRYSSPNKLFEAMMLGKPIVVARGTHTDELVEQYGCGIVVPYGDVRALNAALDRLASDPDLRQALGQAGRRAYETCYHWDQMQARLLNLYQDLLTKRG